MGDKTSGALYHAGVVDGDEILTQRAKDLFIEEIKKELTLGTDGFSSPFPCGPKIQANPYANLLELENEEKFPDFHKQIIKGQYEKIAAALNIQGGYMILPVVDPFALAASLDIKLDIDVDFPGGFMTYLIPNLPKLALELDIMPPIKLAAKLPGLLKIPPELPELSIPPIPNPQLDFSPGLNADLKFALKVPAVLLQLIGKLPSLILNIPGLPSAVCELVFNSGLFPVIPDASVRIVAYKVMVRKISEMLMIVASGKVIGSSPQGITGGLGRHLGYIPPTDEQPGPKRSTRDRIIEYAEACVDLSWGDKKTREDYASRLLYTEFGDGTPKNTLKRDDPQYDPRVIGKAKTIIKCSQSSSCGMLARSCFFAGGASYVFRYAGQPLLNKHEKTGTYYDYFTDEYRLVNGNGIAIEALVQAAKAKNALVTKVKNDLPQVLKGDIIIVYDPRRSGREHVLIVAEDYDPGSHTLVTIEGGQPDAKNKGRPTAIRKKQYVPMTLQEIARKPNPLDPPYGFNITPNGIVRLSGRDVYLIIDGERLCTSKIGTNINEPDRTLDFEIFDRNDPTTDANQGLLSD